MALSIALAGEFRDAVIRGFHRLKQTRQTQVKRRLNVYYSGTVQGVGFRFTTQRIAGRFDISGYVKNLPDGRVEMAAEGETGELEAFREAMRRSEIGRYMKDEQVAWSDANGEFDGFQIVY